MISPANQPVLAHRVRAFRRSRESQVTGCQIRLTHTVQGTVPRHGIVGLRGMVGGLVGAQSFFGHHSSWQRLRLGGNAQGPFDHAGGAVGSSDLSPEVVVWVTSGDVLSGIGSKSSKGGAGLASGEMTLKLTKKGKLSFEGWV